MKTMNSRVPVSLSASAAVLVLLLGAASLCADETKPAPVPATNAPVAAESLLVAPPKPKVNKQAEENAQGRLQPTTPEKLIEKHGPVGAIFAKPARVNPLQLINPLAPAEYGGLSQPAAVWSWDPMLAPGQGPRPRAFQDDRTHEASGVLISVGSR